MSHYCPTCGARAASDSAGTPLRCSRSGCDWRLITLEEWRGLPPAQQGYALYMQGAWPTSEIAAEKNPYVEDSAEWSAFQQGEQRAVLEAQDGEE